MVNPAGLVKEVYGGPLTSCKAAGLRPGEEFVFSVKATYSDSSYVRSGPACFSTRMA